MRGGRGGEPGPFIRAGLDGRWYEWSTDRGAYVYTDGLPPPPPRETWAEAITAFVVPLLFTGSLALVVYPFVGIFMLLAGKPQAKFATLALAVPVALVALILIANAKT